MKPAFLSRTIGLFMLGVLASLSIIVGTGPQQAVQAQAPAAKTQPSTSLTIAEVISQSGGEYDDNNQDFDILLNAVKQTDLVGVLSDANADFTVFAPTDEAFLKFSRFLGYTGNKESAVLDVINKDLAKFYQAEREKGETNPESFTLRDQIIYHFANGTKSLAELNSLTGDKRVLESLLGDNSPGDNEPELINYGLAYLGGTIGDASITSVDPKIIPELADLSASNGVIHGIDRVLNSSYFSAKLPTTIADVLAQSGTEFDTNDQDFDILNKLLLSAELREVFADPDADLTLFAPTDEAFIKLRAVTAGGLDPEARSTYTEVAAHSEFANFLSRADQLTRDLPEGGRGTSAVEILQNVLKYHTSAGTQMAAEIQTATAPISTLLEGSTIRSENGKLVDQMPDFPDPQLQTGKTDITASNGVIQAIDYVLLPQIFPDVSQGN